MVRRLLMIGSAAVVFAAAPPPAGAHFHSMQIHKVIAGINGFTGVQAIQLRMRQAAQDSVNLGRLRVWDAAGQNPIVLVDPTTAVLNGLPGARILLASANFSSFTTPPAQPDFILENLIPDAYLAAGSLTWESDAGNVYWRLSWGGAGYTGSTLGSPLNDDDGDYGPPCPGPLPSSTLECLRCNLAYFDVSTTNAADYGIAPGAATFANNMGDQVTVFSPPTSIGPLGAPQSLAEVTAHPNPFASVVRVAFQLALPTHVRFSIHDVRGRRVSSSEATLAAGSRAFEWSGVDPQGRPVPAGVYFYRLETGSSVRSGPLVLMH